VGVRLGWEEGESIFFFLEFIFLCFCGEGERRQRGEALWVDVIGRGRSKISQRNTGQVSYSVVLGTPEIN
jgi:hypothetical protein